MNILLARLSSLYPNRIPQGIKDVKVLLKNHPDLIWLEIDCDDNLILSYKRHELFDIFNKLIAMERGFRGLKPYRPEVYQSTHGHDIKKYKFTKVTNSKTLRSDKLDLSNDLSNDDIDAVHLIKKLKKFK